MKNVQGGILFGPSMGEVITVAVDGYPQSLRIEGVPEAYSCGGSSVAVEVVELHHGSFKILVNADCTALITWEYRL